MEEKELGKTVKLEESRKAILREILEDQFSLVESLKESLGITTKLTEYENSQLKNAKAITNLIASQNTGLTSIADKKKEIAKNTRLIEKTTISQAALQNDAIKTAKIIAKEVKDKSKSLDELLQKQFESQDLSIKDQNTIAENISLEKEASAEAQSRLDLILNGMTAREQSAYFEELSVENLKKANAARVVELGTLEEIEGSMGLTNKLARGLSKIPGLGGLESSAEKVKQQIIDIVEETGKVPGKWASFGMLLKQFGKDTMKNLVDPATIATFAVKQLTDIFKKMDTLTSGTARNFGISNKAAIEMNKELRETAENTNDAFVTTIALNASMQELSNRYGTQSKLSKEMLVTYTQLTKKAGVSAEAAGAFADTTFLTGKELKQTTAEYRGQVKILKATTGLALNEKEIMEGIKNISASIKLQLRGSAEAMATAVFKAKALGLEMKDLESISSSLLSFQSSIEDELAAELLTGKQLNLEGARYAALIGDQAMLAEELAANFGTAAEFGDMNVIQQAALAKSVGLTKDTLAESLMKREAMAALSKFEGDTEKEKYENAVKRLGVEGARLELGNEALANQMESVSLQERLAAAGEKFQEALMPLAEKVMPYMEKAFKFVGDNIDGIVSALKVIIPLMLLFKVAAIATAVANVISASAITFGAGGAAALIAGTAAVTYMATVGDLSMPANGPTITDPKEGGIYSMSPNDDIMAGPGLVRDYNTLKNNKASTAGNTQSASTVNVTPSDTKITLNLDGQAIGNANARQSYGVGSTVKAFGGAVDMSAYT